MDCSQRAGSHSFHAPLPHTVKEQGHLNSKAASPSVSRRVLTKSGCSLGLSQCRALSCVSHSKRELCDKPGAPWQDVPHIQIPPSVLQEPMMTQVGPFETLLRFQAMHLSKVTVCKSMNSMKAGHWHKQLLKFLFWLELVSALLCKTRSKGIKLSRWGNLESLTLDVASRERQTFCLEK